MVTVCGDDKSGMVAVMIGFAIVSSKQGGECTGNHASTWLGDSHVIVSGGVGS